ncbi:CLUMA_CG018995, isoform A [Clunio marinus]|uniref:CLUMA_CG018995, isoform A n=1 Tax=Clunio marinus TaxID=568069 RepID=A0A1J1J2H4_9DIPT|nr:CLUMA_CG018995, isoform A [Clunio marinus]
MEDSRTSDISKTTLDLVDLSTNENDASAPPAVDDDSLHPTGTRGFCVKEYEEQMQLLKKENFNLKLRLYFLEEKNPNIPEGAETLYKQNIDLKVEVDSLEKDVQEKQDLLCQASKALELLDVQKSNDLKHSQMKIDELNQKVESLEHEVSSLQDALSNANKPNLGNDTGYADFLGAIDNRDIELQRKMVEIRDVEKKFLEQISDMNVKVKELQDQKKVIEERASNLDYDNSEMKDKLSQVEATMTQQVGF